MRHDVALRLYDVGWIVGTAIVFLMNYMMDQNVPWELALVVVLFFLGLCRWGVEIVTTSKRNEKKVDEPKKEEKKENHKKEEKKEVRHDRKKDGRRWF